MAAWALVRDLAPEGPAAREARRHLDAGLLDAATARTPYGEVYGTVSRSR